MIDTLQSGVHEIREAEVPQGDIFCEVEAVHANVMRVVFYHYDGHTEVRDMDSILLLKKGIAHAHDQFVLRVLNGIEIIESTRAEPDSLDRCGQKLEQIQSSKTSEWRSEDI